MCQSRICSKYRRAFFPLRFFSLTHWRIFLCLVLWRFRCCLLFHQHRLYLLPSASVFSSHLMSRPHKCLLAFHIHRKGIHFNFSERTLVWIKKRQRWWKGIKKTSVEIWEALEKHLQFLNENSVSMPICRKLSFQLFIWCHF